MAGRTRKFNPVLSEQDKATLEKIVSSRTEEIRKVQRAKDDSVGRLREQ